MEIRGSFKYELVVGDTVVYCGAISGSQRRGAEHRVRWSNGHARQEGWRTKQRHGRQSTDGKAPALQEATATTPSCMDRSFCETES